MELDDKILEEAVLRYNSIYMEQIPENVKGHIFSEPFEKKMKKLIKWNNHYGKNIWIGHFTMYASRIAIAACLIVVFSTPIYLGMLGPKIGSLFEKVNGTLPDGDSNPWDNYTSPKKPNIINMPKYRLAVPDGYKEGPMQIIKDDNYLWIQEFESDDSKVTFKQDLLTKYEPEEMTPKETVEKEVAGRKIVISSYEDKVIAEYKGSNYYIDIIIEGKDATVEMAEKFAENITDR
ncbi:MAG: hypothetical protein E7254_01095 [Lachnospiraceae bacterium]|nr:hypothetical protein [Lachnospiraceae bacterium]